MTTFSLGASDTVCVSKRLQEGPVETDVVWMEELGQEGRTYLAHKGYKLGGCWALIQAQPELRVVIRSHRELDVS